MISGSNGHPESAPLKVGQLLIDRIEVKKLRVKLPAPCEHIFILLMVGVGKHFKLFRISGFQRMYLEKKLESNWIFFYQFSLQYHCTIDRRRCSNTPKHHARLQQLYLYCLAVCSDLWAMGGDIQ